jgi:hypothetical protein
VAQIASVAVLRIAQRQSSQSVERGLALRQSPIAGQRVQLVEQQLGLGARIGFARASECPE